MNDQKTPGNEPAVNPPNQSVDPTNPASSASLPFHVVGIGASAGGLQALEEFFENVPADSGLAYVVVQHLSPDHTSLLSEILSRKARIPVREIEDGTKVEPNQAFVIAPGHTLTLENGLLKLGEPVEQRGHRRPVDDFFRSLAAEQNEKAVAVILSGTGTNGTAGAQAIKAAGGICIAQQPESASFPGMPRSLIHAGYADQVLEARDIPGMLMRYARYPFTGDGASLAADDALQLDRAHLREILAILRTRTKHDFVGYRKATLIRRIQRRMGLVDTRNLSDYTSILRSSTNEVGALANDLMINVTGFFRDPEAWEALRVSVIMPLIASKQEGQTIRCWVSACASGEEAYTLAILIAEELGSREHIDVKIFATDTADRSLALARAGVYPGGIEADLTPERLERFFDKDEHAFRVKKEIRDMVVFAPQDLLRDPPFSRIDICSCRNLLIYLEPDTQRRVLSLLHFALRDGAYLFLGNTESFSGSEHLFEVISKKWRIYRRTGAAQLRFAGGADTPSLRLRDETARYNESLQNPDAPRPTATLFIQRALLEHYGPPTVVVDRTDRIVYFHGATGEFLDPPAGEPTRDLLQLLRTPLRVPVRTALRAAMRDNTAVTVQVPGNETGRREVDITAAPLIHSKAPDYYRVSFSPPASGTLMSQSEIVVRDTSGNDAAAGEERRLLRLELQSATEAYEATNEELKAAHEEATSVNEELQSANEELETSKEELQSINEELTTVNGQLQLKISQLEATTNDIANLLSSTNIAVLFLDSKLRVRRFTPAVSDLLELIDTDIGRPVTDLAQKFTDDNLLTDVRTVLQHLAPIEREIESHSGRWYLRRTLPYRTSENHIEGVVITFVDICARKRSELEVRKAHERVQGVLEQMPTAVVIVDPLAGHLQYANRRASSLFGKSLPPPAPAGAGTRFEPSLSGVHSDGEAYLADEWPLARTLATGETITDEEIEVIGTDKIIRVFTVSSAPVRNAKGTIIAVVGTFLDITQRRRGEEALAEANQRLGLLVESAMDFAIMTLDDDGRIVSWNSGAERMLGWTEKELIGKTAEAIFTPEDRLAQVPQREIREALDTGRATDERWHLRKDGSRFWASGVMARMTAPSGAVTGLVKIMRDNTEAKVTEDRLKAAMAAAERASAHAEEANRAKDEFIAVVSHELRTPLNTIRLWTRMLANEKLPPKDRADGLEMITRAAVAQQQVIDDLFDVSRIASGKLKLALHETQLANVVKGAVEAVEPVATARGIRLSSRAASDLGVVRADPGRLQQVIWNLLSNAVKFTPQGGSVSVAARRDGAMVTIEVVDTGVGIKREFLPHVFDRFRQAEVGAARAHGGLGLGLAIAKQIVELHGGTITVFSEGDGQGSTFRVELPLPVYAGADDSGEARAFDIGDQLDDVEILLVEDESNAREVMQRLLQERGAKVRAVESAAQAREALEMRRPRLIISDIGLPGEDGYAFMREIRARETNGRIAALAVTAFARPEDRQQALDAGYDEHVPKPVDPDRLLELAAKLAARP
ncbi:MAG TPA: chemotaxis protein CheB [Steroidobacteraceae bacterium]|nr:chemotaxis protein CheB [Steroidobacteraceae bacterium]